MNQLHLSEKQLDDLTIRMPVKSSKGLIINLDTGFHYHGHGFTSDYFIIRNEQTKKYYKFIKTTDPTGHITFTVPFEVFAKTITRTDVTYSY